MDTIMALPENIEVKENITSYYWFDENGILCSINKKTQPLPFEQIVKLVEDLKELTGNKKVCMLMDVTHSPSSTKQTREYTAQELPKLVKALALVSKSAISRLLAYLFFALVTTPFPAKMFATEKDAKAWLKQYL
jgi:hypothetical protein